MVVVAESRWRATFLFLEDAIEVADVVKATTVADLGHVGVGIDKQASGITETDVDDVVADSLARSGAEKARESGGSHACNICQSLQANLFLEVLVDVLFHGTNATAFGLVLHVGKRLAGQQMIVILK